MKRNDAEPIGKLIQQFLRQESLESPLNEQRLLDAWPQILGPAANYTSNLYIRNQTLYVHLTSAALRQELMMGREKLVRALNQKVGATVITNIIFAEEGDSVYYLYSQCPESFVCTVVIKRGFQILIIVGIYSDDSGTSFGCCYLPKSGWGMVVILCVSL